MKIKQIQGKLSNMKKIETKDIVHHLVPLIASLTIYPTLTLKKCLCISLKPKSKSYFSDA